MELPNRERAYLPAAKLTGYLLSETHPVGSSKAKFFRALGFNDLNVPLLEDGLLAIAHTGVVDEVEPTKHGTKYGINGPLETPSGRIVQIRTIWFIGANEDAPRFVTAYPA
jgi:hypothetical protein